MLACISVIACYAVGLDGPFLLDDFTNLNRLEWLDGSWQGVSSLVFGSEQRWFNRPLSYLSFWPNASDWPGNPSGFKIVSLFIHFANAALLYWFVGLLTSRALKSSHYLNFAFAAALIWAVMPAHVSTVLYAVQRMTLLSTMFMLLGLVCYLKFRLSAGGRSWIYLAGALLALCGAVLTKENGLTLIVLVASLEFYLLTQWGCEYKHNKLPRVLLFLLVCGCFAFIFIFVYFSLASYSGYGARDFSLLERLSIESIILLDYVRLSFLPISTTMTLYHDAYELRVADLYHLGFVVWVFHATIFVLALFYFRRLPLVCFGVVWFYLSHIIESTFIPLELMFEHRNYFPIIGLIIAICGGVEIALNKLSGFGERSRHVFHGGVGVLFVLFLIGLYKQATVWGDGFELKARWAAEQPFSARAQYDFAVTLDSVGRKDLALKHILSVKDRFYQLGFTLYEWRLRCATNSTTLTGFPTSKEIAQTPFSTEVTFQLRALLESWAAGACIPSGMTNDELDEYLNAFLEMPKLDRKAAYKAEMLVVQYRFYRELKRVDVAIKKALELYSVQPSIDTALMNVDLAMQFGLTSYASEYLGYAKKMQSSNLLRHRDTIKHFESLLKRNETQE